MISKWISNFKTATLANQNTNIVNFLCFVFH